MHVRDARFFIEPYFDAVRDVFAQFSPAPGVCLSKLAKTQLIVDSGVRDTRRHFAACRDDGREIRVAPELVELGVVEHLVPVLTHEMGHAADFAYPASFWLVQRGQPAMWAPPEGKGAARARERWYRRGDHEVELWADAVASLVTGRAIRYSGPCWLQTFGRGRERPAALR